MRRYESWIRETQTALREAIEEAEEAGWHHRAEGGETPANRIYARLRTWEAALTERVEYYDQSKPRR